MPTKDEGKTENCAVAMSAIRAMEIIHGDTEKREVITAAVNKVHKEFHHAEQITGDILSDIWDKAVEATIAQSIKWAEDNHSHHEFADEEVPKGQYGCDDKDYPYVNSLELVKFLSALKNK